MFSENDIKLKRIKTLFHAPTVLGVEFILSK